MERSPRRHIGKFVGMCILTLVLFSRTPGADTVRWVQILLLLVAGACAGVALAGALGVLKDRRAP
jgi:ABC-type uncharacterized transport system permease subunit